MNEPIQRFDRQYSWLSNFHPVRVTLLDTVYERGLTDEGDSLKDTATYHSVEHAYQAAKFFLLENRKVINCLTAGAAKRHARSFAPKQDGWDKAAWVEKSLVFMEQLIAQKFADPVLQRLLLNTGDVTLIEGNYWHDNFWGACLCATCKDVASLNHLGRLLMHRRAALREQGGTL